MKDLHADAASHGFHRVVVTLPRAISGPVPLPRRWAVERFYGRMTGFRGLARDYVRLRETRDSFHRAAFGILTPQQSTSPFTEVQNAHYSHSHSRLKRANVNAFPANPGFVPRP